MNNNAQGFVTPAERITPELLEAGENYVELNRFRGGRRATIFARQVSNGHLVVITASLRADGQAIERVLGAFRVWPQDVETYAAALSAAAKAL